MHAFDYVAPRTLREVVALLAEPGPATRLLAGGTDLLVQLREGRRRADRVVDVKHVAELNELKYTPTAGLRFGASVPCYRLAEHAEVRQAYPGLIDAVSLVGGVQIQSRASVGGNLCNASPAADTIPALIAGQARCLIGSATELRELPVEAFCVGPGKNALAAGEMLVSVTLPPPGPRSGSAYLRFIPRNEMDIAVVGVGVSVTLDGDRCTAARIALAAVAPTPVLAGDAADALIDTKLTDADLDQAANRARAAAKPISDMRGDADYRRHLVGVLVKRALTIATSRAKGS